MPQRLQKTLKVFCRLSVTARSSAKKPRSGCFFGVRTFFTGFSATLSRSSDKAGFLRITAAYAIDNSANTAEGSITSPKKTDG